MIFLKDFDINRKKQACEKIHIKIFVLAWKEEMIEQGKQGVIQI